MGDDHVLVTELQSMLPHTPPHPHTHTHTHTHTHAHTCIQTHTYAHKFLRVWKILKIFVVAGLKFFENWGMINWPKLNI